MWLCVFGCWRDTFGTSATGKVAALIWIITSHNAMKHPIGSLQIVYKCYFGKSLKALCCVFFHSLTLDSDWFDSSEFVWNTWRKSLIAEPELLYLVLLWRRGDKKLKSFKYVRKKRKEKVLLHSEITGGAVCSDFVVSHSNSAMTKRSEEWFAHHKHLRFSSK